MNIENDKRYEYCDCFVVFIDILGIKEKVKASIDDNEILRNIINVVKINSIFTNKSTKETSEHGPLRIRSWYFSDSFAFIMKEDHINLPHFFFIIRYIHDKMVEHECLIRGSIHLGKMYFPEENENVLLGPALIDAYKIESEIAIYPRIVISDELYDYIVKNNSLINNYPLHSTKKIEEFIKEDVDGVKYFDILNPYIIRDINEKIQTSNNSFWIQWYDENNSKWNDIIKNIEEIISGNSQDRRINQKNKWLRKNIDRVKKYKKKKPF